MQITEESACFRHFIFRFDYRCLTSKSLRLMCQVLLTISLHHFLETISAVPQVLDSFDEELWRATIEKVTVFHDGKMIFQFLDGTEIQG